MTCYHRRGFCRHFLHEQSRYVLSWAVWPCSERGRHSNCASPPTRCRRSVVPRRPCRRACRRWRRGTHLMHPTPATRGWRAMERALGDYSRQVVHLPSLLWQILRKNADAFICSSLTTRCRLCPYVFSKHKQSMGSRRPRREARPTASDVR